MVHLVVCSVQLAPVEHLETSPPQEPEHLGSADVKFRRLVFREPVKPMHAFERLDQALGDPFLVGRGDHLEVGVAHENQLTAGTQQTSSLGDPFELITPDRGAVFGEDEIE